jgi:hypothetical protein
MAWTNIDNALVSVGALPFATTIQALRDNPIAIANADAGAPPVSFAAISAGIAGASAGAIGTYVFADSSTTSDVAFGSTRPGSQLRPTSAARGITFTAGPVSGDATFTVGSTLSGTWRAMGYYDYADGSGALSALGATLWLRIS